jgi:hypothetical protein
VCGKPNRSSLNIHIQPHTACATTGRANTRGSPEPPRGARLLATAAAVVTRGTDAGPAGHTAGGTLKARRARPGALRGRQARGVSVATRGAVQLFRGRGRGEAGRGGAQGLDGGLTHPDGAGGVRPRRQRLPCQVEGTSRARQHRAEREVQTHTHPQASAAVGARGTHGLPRALVGRLRRAACGGRGVVPCPHAQGRP